MNTQENLVPQQQPVPQHNQVVQAQPRPKQNQVPPPAKKRKLLNLILKDDAALHSSYMPFVRGGAIFVPTNSKSFRFGDEVVVSMHLQSTNKKLAIPGQVVWIAPASCERGEEGLGIQFAGTTKAKVRLIIETMLGNRANVPPLVRFY
ncbi:MAG TPA: pilus assembly protein PilZ [Leucothrix sp.]|nr:pilus assembly protein PilZ [Leucothrix sp.]